jgi:ribosomal protein S18 acetylase RimI-like enzyme
MLHPETRSGTIPIMNFTIRPLRPTEAESYREIRLEALRLHPEAFGSAFEQESLRPLTFFEARLTETVIFGGFLDDALLGTAGFMADTGLKRKHKGHLWGMYVRPAARGTGLSRALVQVVLEHAKERVELIQLSVVAENATARRLYTSLGFEPFGIEQRSLLVGGRYFDEVLMVKMLA